MQFQIDEQVTANGETFFVTEHKRGSECVFLRRTFDSPGATAYPAHMVRRIEDQAESVSASIGSAIARVQKESAKRLHRT